MKYVLDKNSEYKNFRKKFSLLRIIFSPLLIIFIILLLSVIALICFSDFIFTSSNLHIFVYIFTFFAILYIINSREAKDSYRVAWILVFCLLPIFGVLFYVVTKFLTNFGNNKSKLVDIITASKKCYRNSCNDEINRLIDDHMTNKKAYIDSEVREHLLNEYSFFHYFDNYTCFESYVNTELHYFDNGKEAFEDILEKLSEAKKFIFIEIFILSDGIIWEEMLKILKEKAQNGVDVKVMFDGLNAISSFGESYCKELAEYGIEAKVFKPIKPVLSNTQNNRDHRKIFVIDNEIAYTGGINIADEYANLYERFGVWKDVAVRVVGNAVESFTIMFLQVWQLDQKSNIYEFDKYLPLYDKKIQNEDPNHLIVPYTDYPNLAENISLQIYKYLLNTAHDYFYIMTPYLVIDEALADTIEAASKRGVDIRIVVPHIQDKKYVFYVNRSFYKQLTLAGVKVYEYLPGFVHAKVYLQDDIRAVVGTANFDYRSLYLHSENGLYFFADTDTIKSVKADFEETFKVSKLMTLEDITLMPMKYKVFGAILKMFAPLM